MAMTQAKTMIYTVDLGNGQVAEVEGPEGATPEQLQAFIGGADLGAPAPQQDGAPQNAPLDPTGSMDIGFADPTAAEANSRPEGSDAYTSEVNQGIANGTIASPEDLKAVAGKYGFYFPDEAKLTEVFEALKGGASFGGANPAEYASNISENRDMSGAGGAGESLRAFGRGTLGSLGLDDEILAAVDTATGDGSYQENLARNRAVRDFDQNNNFWARLAGEFVAGAALPSGVQNSARKAGVAAIRAGLGREAAEQAARVAAARQLGVEGAVYGGAYGAGEADGSITDRLGGAVVGAATGGLAGRGLGAVGASLGNRAAARASRPLTEGQEVAQAAERQRIDVLPADVGGPMTRRATSAVAQTVAGGSPVINAARRATSQVEERRDEIASIIGNAVSNEAAGNEVAQGVKSAMQTLGNEARAFYGPAESQAKGFQATPTKALDELDQQIAELSQVAGGAEGLTTLQAIRDDLAAGKTTIAGIRNMRTALRDRFRKDGLAGSDIERRTNRVVDAAAQDMEDSLIASGMRDAADNFARGDAKWRERAKLVDQVFEPIVGTRDNPKAGEQIVKTIRADLQNNNARAVRLLRSLPPSEQGNLRASIISSLGHLKEGRDFSLETFAKNWADIGESAKKAYFGDEAMAALDDLAKIARGTSQAQQYANRSNTGGAVGNLATLGTTLAGIPTFLATVGGQYAIGRALASPRVARWLAKVPKKPNAAAERAHIKRLGAIAKSEPAIANELTGLQDMLLQAANDNLSRAAASGDNSENQ